MIRWAPALAILSCSLLHATEMFVSPLQVDARLSSPFGERFHPVHQTGNFHTGIDLAAPSGTTVVSVADGVVLVAGELQGYGKTIIIDHGDGMTTRYAHLKEILVKQDAHVSQGNPIGLVGKSGTATASHLHFEFRRSGMATDPTFIIYRPKNAKYISSVTQ